MKEGRTRDSLEKLEDARHATLNGNYVNAHQREQEREAKEVAFMMFGPDGHGADTVRHTHRRMQDARREADVQHMRRTFRVETPATDKADASHRSERRPFWTCKDSYVESPRYSTQRDYLRSFKAAGGAEPSTNTISRHGADVLKLELDNATPADGQRRTGHGCAEGGGGGGGAGRYRTRGELWEGRKAEMHSACQGVARMAAVAKERVDKPVVDAVLQDAAAMPTHRQRSAVSPRNLRQLKAETPLYRPNRSDVIMHSHRWW